MCKQVALSDLDAEREDDLSGENEAAEEECAPAHAGDAVDDEAAEEGEHRVGPRVDRVQRQVHRVVVRDVLRLEPASARAR